MFDPFGGGGEEGKGGGEKQPGQGMERRLIRLEGKFSRTSDHSRLSSLRSFELLIKARLQNF